jgi:cell division protein FtsQ
MSDSNEKIPETDQENMPEAAGEADDRTNGDGGEETREVSDAVNGDDSTDAVEQNMKKRREDRRKKASAKPRARIIAIAVAAAAVLLLVCARSSYFTVDSIEVEGNSYYSDDEIVNMAHAETGGNIFFGTGKHSIIKYLEEDPYIENARVYRKLPSTLVISVDERKQLGAVIYGDEYLVIDKDGILLRKTETEPQLTIINGIKIKKMDLGEPIAAADKKTFSRSMKLLNAMEDGDLYFKEISVSGNRVKANVYDALVVYGKYSDVMSAIKENRLQTVLEELFNRNIKRGTISITSDGYASFTPKVN